MTYRRGMLSDFFEGVAVKKLTLVETVSPKSNQHEVQGTKPLRGMFGDADRKSIPTRFIWLNDEQEGLSEDGFISWSNVRKGKPRSAEYHLYYSGNIVTEEAMKPGDSLFLALRRDGAAMFVVVPLDSTIQSQLLWLFGIDEQPELAFAFKEISGDNSARLDFAARYVLDELGIDLQEPEVDAIDPLIARFGTTFPTTREFSAFARQTLSEVSPLDDPDAALFAWMEREELLFRRLERHIIAEQMSGVSGNTNALVEGFLSLSMQLHQRRRSRAGRALENHLETILEAYGVRYARGAETENRNRPDFLFPGAAEYADPAFAADRLTMLGAKFTLKDRWRQVLAEANRIQDKHLLTMEPGISGNQTSQIAASRLQLVIPRPLHSTFTSAQQAMLMDVRAFLRLVQTRQAR